MDGWTRMVWKLAIFVTKNTMPIPTIQTHCIELAIFVPKITMSIPTIKKTMHGMEMWDGWMDPDGMEIGNLCHKNHNVHTNNPNALY